jgi:hypothetical protein
MISKYVMGVQETMAGRNVEWAQRWRAMLYLLHHEELAIVPLLQFEYLLVELLSLG